MKIDFSRWTKIFTGGDRPPFEKYYLTVLFLFIAYLVADLSTLYVREYLLPTTPPPKKMIQQNDLTNKSYSFSDVVANNIFNMDHKIPPSIGEMEGGMGPADGAPRPTSLPLELLGTIVHANPQKSLATVVLKGQNKVEPFKVGEKIMDMAEVKEIQREKVIFRNLRTQILEFIEVPKDDKITISTERGFTASAPTSITEKTEFNFKRNDIDKMLENFPQLLSQARVVPEIGSDGNVVGYRMVEMQPGSAYDKIGMKIGDVIKSVNNEEVTNPQKAMELYQALRSENSIKVKVLRNGQETTLNYTIQ